MIFARQYTVDGHCRPTFQQMVFLQDDMVDFPDIGHGHLPGLGRMFFLLVLGARILWMM
jgi:hypothetical protein